ncbi:MAG: MarR family transcriptional regulator [bacterium]
MKHTGPHAYRHQEQIKQSLQEAGYSAAAVDALLALDVDNFQYVRRVMKGDLPQSLIAEIGSGLEITLFHALSAILRIQNGYGRAVPQEVTVGLLAEEMNLDPSRASRIAADLVDRGYVARAVSQEDGRRSVLTTTDAAYKLMEAFRQAKWQRTMRLFSTWSEDDILTFSRLFGRYAEGMRDQYPGLGCGPLGPRPKGEAE